MAFEHDASQWQVTLSSDPTFASPVEDSGTDTVNLTSYQVVTPLDYSTEYIWRVRFRYVVEGWSEYSDPTSFTTEAEILSMVRVTGDGEDRVTGDGEQRVILEV